jgi:hypothetical protein
MARRILGALSCSFGESRAAALAPQRLQWVSVRAASGPIFLGLPTLFGHSALFGLAYAPERLKDRPDRREHGAASHRGRYVRHYQRVA